MNLRWQTGQMGENGQEGGYRFGSRGYRPCWAVLTTRAAGTMVRMFMIVGVYYARKTHRRTGSDAQGSAAPGWVVLRPGGGG